MDVLGKLFILSVLCIGIVACSTSSSTVKKMKLDDMDNLNNKVELVLGDKRYSFHKQVLTGNSFSIVDGTLNQFDLSYVMYNTLDIDILVVGDEVYLAFWKHGSPFTLEYSYLEYIGSYEPSTQTVLLDKPAALKISKDIFPGYESTGFISGKFVRPYSATLKLSKLYTFSGSSYRKPNSEHFTYWRLNYNGNQYGKYSRKVTKAAIDKLKNNPLLSPATSAKSTCCGCKNK